jgi:hypothetical protein
VSGMLPECSLVNVGEPVEAVAEVVLVVAVRRHPTQSCNSSYGGGGPGKGVQMQTVPDTDTHGRAAGTGAGMWM